MIVDFFYLRFVVIIVVVVVVVVVVIVFLFDTVIAIVDIYIRQH